MNSILTHIHTFALRHPGCRSVVPRWRGGAGGVCEEGCSWGGGGVCVSRDAFERQLAWAARIWNCSVTCMKNYGWRVRSRASPILSWRLIMNSFLQSFPSLPLILLSYAHKVLTAFSSLPRKSVVLWGRAVILVFMNIDSIKPSLQFLIL